MEGTMLWFNPARRRGFVHTDEGQRLRVDHDEFAAGRKSTQSVLKRAREQAMREKREIKQAKAERRDADSAPAEAVETDATPAAG